jgi:hypothetical protein
MVFARDTSDALTSLVKKIDAANSSTKGMGSFVVFCSDAEGLDKKLKELADKEKLKNTILSIDNPSGPEPYKVAKDADVTVVLYDKRKVLHNYAFKKGELKDKDVDKILEDLTKSFGN